MNFMLMDITEPEANRIFQIRHFPARIGNQQNVEVSIPHDGVSRMHAGIIRREGRYFVVDLGSRNGTRLHRVQGGDLVSKPAPVADSLDPVDERLLGTGNELQDGLYLAVGAAILKCVVESEPLPGRRDPDRPEPGPEPGGRGVTGLIGACALLVAVTLVLGLRNTRAPDPRDVCRSGPVPPAMADSSRLK